MKKTFLLFLITLFMAGCFAPKQVSQPKQTFNFAYTPKESNKPGSAKMVIAFVKPYYATSFTSANGELFSRFRDALGNDIEQLLIAKGFSMKGPYASYDEMIFEDKKTVEMAIYIEIAPSFTAQEGGWKMNVSLLGPKYNTYSYSGTASLIGKINISGVEPLTNQKIWAKSVSIPNVENIPIETSVKYNHQLTSFELINDPGVYNALGKALTAQYAGIMDKISDHFNVEELNSLKQQIKELKSKKGY